MQKQKELVLPDLLALCPFPLSANPHYDQVRIESAQWVTSFKAFSGRKLDHFAASDFERLAAYACPNATYEQLRLCADMINHISVMDMLCDDLDGVGVREVGDEYLAALTLSPVSNGIISRMVSEFRGCWDQHVAANSNTTRRFINHSRLYFNWLTHEAELRERSEPFRLTLEEFMQFRRENSAICQSFDLIEMCNNIDLPDEVTEDKVFEQAYISGLNMGWLINDIVSFAMEQSEGLEEANIIVFLRRARGMTLQEATDHTGVIFKTFLDNFMKARQDIRSFGTDIDREVGLYIQGIENWVIGIIHWSFDCQRYFGKEGQEVKRSRVAKLGTTTFAHLD